MTDRRCGLVPRLGLFSKGKFRKPVTPKFHNLASVQCVVFIDCLFGEDNSMDAITKRLEFGPGSSFGVMV